MVSEIRFAVHDPGFRMHNNNYFMIGRTVRYINQTFEIAAVALAHTNNDSCEVTARLQATQQMRRDKGAMDFGEISPSSFASMMATKFGLKAFIEDSAVDGSIVREAEDKKEESTFDVLQRLAGKLNFRFFEANGTLFFASQSFLVKNQPSFTINVPSGATDAFYANSIAVRRSADGEQAATAQVSLLQNTSTLSIFPGSSFKINGLSHFTGTFMVDRVGFTVGPTALVVLSGTDVDETEDMTCSSQSFQFGATGECVKRIQQVVGVYNDGQWGPITNRAVLDYQSSIGLPATGVWGPQEWKSLQKV